MSVSLRPTPGEKLADGIVHVVGMASGLIAALILLGWALVALPALHVAALAIYCGGLVAMLCCSGAYHLVRAPSWKGLLRRLDHAAIFIKIAGTYTPFALVKVGEAAGLYFLAGVWSVALAGAAAKLLLPATWDRLAIGVYLALGWSGVAAADTLSAALTPTVLVLLAAGGLLYTFGVVFFVWERLRFQTAIWHGFVLAATACHFGAVTVAVAG